VVVAACEATGATSMAEVAKVAATRESFVIGEMCPVSGMGQACVGARISSNYGIDTMETGDA
jgi:hypothetical protein